MANRRKSRIRLWRGECQREKEEDRARILWEFRGFFAALLALVFAGIYLAIKWLLG